MGNFALVSYDVDDRPQKNFINKLSHLLSRKNKKIKQQQLKFSDLDLNCYLIQLPYSLTDIKEFSDRKSRKLEEQLIQVCSEANIQEIIYPGNLMRLGIFNITSIYTGKYIYESLLLRILNEIFTLRGIKLSNLDIAFIHGDNYQELYSLVWFLSPFIKYLTIVTEDKDIIMNELEKLCEDTGLSVRLTNDLKNGLADCDVVINLLNLTDFNNATRIKTKAIVINYNGSDIGKLFEKNEMINGIEIKIPDKIKSIIPEHVQKLYTSAELSEIVLIHKEEHGGFLTSGSYKLEALISLDREFERLGFKINGFVGRHGFLNRENISISSTKSGKVI